MHFSHVFMILYVNFYKSTKNKCDETSKVQYIRFRGLNFGHACMHYENRYVLLPENKSSSTEFAMSTIFLHYLRTDKLNTASRQELSCFFTCFAPNLIFPSNQRGEGEVRGLQSATIPFLATTYCTVHKSTYQTVYAPYTMVIHCNPCCMYRYIQRGEL